MASIAPNAAPMPAQQPQPLPQGPQLRQLHLGGAPRFVGSGGAVVVLAARDAALLAWLALEEPTPRARLAALPWPDSDAVRCGRPFLSLRPGT